MRNASRMNVSLRLWLVLLLLVAVALTALMVGSGILLYRLPQVETRAMAVMQDRSQEAQRLLELSLDGVETQLRPLVRQLAASPPQGIKSLADDIVSSSPYLNAIMILDLQGRVRSIGVSGANRELADDLSGADLSANPFFLEAAKRFNQSARPVWSDKYLSPISGQSTVGVAVAEGPWIVIGEVSFERLMWAVKRSVRRDDAITTFIDGRGQWLATTDPNPDPSARHHDYGNWDFYQNILKNGTGRARISQFNRDLYAGGVTAPSLSWVIVSVSPAGWAHENFRVTVLLIAGSFAGSLLISLLLAPFWANSVIRPLRKLFARVALATAGDYVSSWPRSGRIKEFNQLGRDLEKMSSVILSREADLARSEARLRATLETTPMVAIQWYDDSGRVLYWNRASETMYGFSAAEAVGVRVTEKKLIYQDLAQAKAFVNMLADIAVSDHPPEPAEFELRRKDGQEIVVLAATFAIPGEDGRWIFVCMDIDLTQRKQAEAALKASEIKLEAIFNASPAPMLVSDVNNHYRCIAVNAAWDQLFKRPQHDLVGKNGAEMGLWVETAQRDQFIASLQRDGVVTGMEAWLIDGEGKRLLCAISALTVSIGSDRLILMMAEDITERRRIEDEIRSLNTRLEERVEKRTRQLSDANEELEVTIDNLKATQEQLVQSEKLAALGNLVAGVAHELNTPIGNGLVAISTLYDRLQEFQQATVAGLRRSTLDEFIETAQTGSDIALRNLRRAAELITSFKQVAIDQTSSQRRRFSLREIIDEILLSLHPTLKRTPYVIELNVDAEIMIDSYPGPLGQVLINLVNNAILHGFDGRDHGRILIEAVPRKRGQIEIRFSDNGKGIPSEQIKRVFDPFFTTRLGRGGSGLGLHVTYNIVTTTLGGSIEVFSQPGEGTTFTLHLPMNIAAPPVA